MGKRFSFSQLCTPFKTNKNKQIEEQYIITQEIGCFGASVWWLLGVSDLGTRKINITKSYP
jgi:hypothetical protein